MPYELGLKREACYTLDPILNRPQQQLLILYHYLSSYPASRSASLKPGDRRRATLIIIVLTVSLSNSYRKPVSAFGQSQNSLVGPNYYFQHNSNCNYSSEP